MRKTLPNLPNAKVHGIDQPRWGTLVQRLLLWTPDRLRDDTGERSGVAGRSGEIACPVPARGAHRITSRKFYEYTKAAAQMPSWLIPNRKRKFYEYTRATKEEKTKGKLMGGNWQSMREVAMT